MPRLKNPGAATQAAVSNFENLPNDALIRVKTVAALVGVSVATIWRWLAAGQFPEPRKLTRGTTAWRVGDVRRFLRGEERIAA